MSQVGIPEVLDGYDTPVGVVDLEVARRNAERVVSYCAEHGLAWRPHVKTHKSLEIARMQLELGAQGLTVATPHEAQVMSTLTDDLLLAYPVVGVLKIAQVIPLLPKVRLRVALDSEEALLPLAAAAADHGREIGILVEVDAGLRRVGLPDPADAVKLARTAASTRGARFDGIMFYAGHIRGTGPDEDAAMAELATFLDRVVEALEEADLPPAIVSGGTTPTLWRSHELPRLTEIRPGTCIYNDRDAVAVGAATPDDWAYSVMATVVSTAVPGRAAVDAGSKALAKEARGGAGFGVLLDRPEVTVVALSEEHGMLDLSNTDWTPRVGDRVRIVPNHVCVSVNLQDHVVGLDAAGAHLIALEGRGRLGWAPSRIGVESTSAPS